MTDMASNPGGASAAALPYRRGVGVMLVNNDGHVFVAKRIVMPSDAWQMPQGGIDQGETPLQAAKREMFEEVGTDKAEFVAESADWYRYDLPADLIGKIWGGRYRGQEQKWFVARFTGKDTDINIATEHPEFLDWKWVEPPQLPRLIVPFKRQLYSDVLREFSGVIAGLRPRRA
jgi:putative (di)nucleoside polyphosphate hydrolase